LARRLQRNALHESPLSTLMIVAALVAVCGTVRAAEAPAAKEKPAADVKAAMDQFSAKRDAMIKERQVLLDQLKNATANSGRRFSTRCRRSKRICSRRNARSAGKSAMNFGNCGKASPLVATADFSTA